MAEVAAAESASRRATRIVAPSAESIADAAEILRAGGLVAMPTETVYGLAADATHERAVAALYAAKGRPRFNPLIAHCHGVEAAMGEARFDEHARALASAFWPGPLTLVVPAGARCRVGLLARAGLPSVALRVPSHSVARALIERVGRPLVAPSANRSGHVSATRAEHVWEDLHGRIDLVVDAGPCPLGVESTIVACLGGRPEMLRLGALALEDIEARLGFSLELGRSAAGRPLAPGALASHYAPHARVRLDALTLEPEWAALDFAGALVGGIARRDLSPTGNLVEAAANLFAFLRELDAAAPAGIAVAPIPSTGLGAAINDRLRRAAIGRA